ncbi:virulence factor MviN [Flavobacteriaceae bacterium TP-CH-4]|uniref:Virulence factor MviN n=1 Tax=Pelagihabitans pacificus TaxID=2696054 RepID=A0A967AX64_9FLAO|nr:lipid II flippase MurJ [Pelagihabitans pacificus]NHF61539.1 virulence factor MviN [Pelagihabitans pacificus]
MKTQFLKAKESLKSLRNNVVVKNILLVGSITLLIKGIGFYKETLIASSFGLSVFLDTFFIAIIVPGFINNVFLGAFKSVFIPNYIAELNTKNNISSFQGTGFFVTAFISAAFMLIAFLFTDTYLDFFFPGHTTEYYNLIKSQFYYLLPCIALWGFSSLLSGLLNINDEFKYSSFESLFLPITIIVCLFFFKEPLGDKVLAVGTLAGAIVSFLFLIIVCFQKKIINISWPDLNNANARIMFAQVPAKVSSGLLTGMNVVVDQYFAAQLVIGSIAAINYGRKIPAFLSGLLVIALTNVLLPYFSKSLAKNKEKTFKTLFKMLKLIFVGVVVCIVLGILATDFMVALFFERKEFTSDDTEVVSNIQKIFLIYLPFSICGMVVVNFLTSINKNAFMAYVSLGALILNIILDYILMQYYGVFGIALCTTIVIILKNIILFYYTYKQSRI